MNGLLVFGVLVSLWFLYSFVIGECAKDNNAKREASRRESEARYHSQLAGKYAATMTEADRNWYASLPDWDKIPLFRSGK